MAKPIEKRSMSDEAVKAKTGKVWSEWFAILDKAGAQKMAHKDIAVWLSEKQGVGDWWCQMVTVEYEKARGMRALHQKADGFAVGASKTINAPVAALYRAFTDARARKKWLPNAKMKITTATENKSLRIAWADPSTGSPTGTSGQASRVSVNFYPKGEAKTQVTIQHEKLANAKAASSMKSYWAAGLSRLAVSMRQGSA